MQNTYTGIVDVDTIRQRLAPILEKGNADLAILFGSYARASQDSRSDVDLIVVDDEDLPYLQRLDKYYNDIARALDTSVDLFVYRRLEYEDMKQGFFVGRAVSEGITIYER
jgi:predicted nucleotidyltransferase